MASPPSAAPPLPIDLDAATSVVSGAYGKFANCALTFDWIKMATKQVIGEEELLEASLASSITSWHPSIFTLLTMLLGVVLLLVGFMFVRPVNFGVGAYIGGSVSLLLLTLFAPATTGCATIVGVPVLIALLLGGICAWKRGSMFAVIGLVAGEVIGRLFFNLTLKGLGAPEYLAFSCIGFFAVVVACLMFYVGDLTWIVGCSVGGAYLLVSRTLQLTTYFRPDWGLGAFVEFVWPDVTRLHDAYFMHRYAAYLVSAPAIYVPLGLVCVLALFGTWFQLKLLAARKAAALVGATKAAALEMVE